ncbi:MAG: hypothetical protein LBL63_04660, partial [Clostridiales Family XIII bacterium]|nr:hypothetical protein [Clostridiales Family XIII bacterium]
MIHLYRFKDRNILLDVGSGAVHDVSDVVFDILSFFLRATGTERSASEHPASERERPALERVAHERDAWARAKPSVVPALGNG